VTADVQSRETAPETAPTSQERARALRRRAGRETVLDLLTPEQVPLHFRAGDAGGRVGALMLDFLIIHGGIFVLALMMVFLTPGWDWSHGLFGSVLLVGGFVVRTFYFPWFELRWQGRTPGKRRAELRVVARDGGPLGTDMVFARNLTRELEIFLPLTLLLGMRGQVLLDTPAWVPLATMVWASVLLLFPLFNRQHLRVGDLVAGTVVVADPRPVLAEDLAEAATRSRAADEDVFRREELEIYGIEELEVLEDVLRRPASPHHEDLLARLAGTIQQKIGWRPEEGQFVQPERFLRAFYAAQRERLEKGLLVGERRETKEG